MRSLAWLWFACCAVLYARRPDALTLPQLYAEDGVIFFREALLSGFAAMPSAYAGYHHLLPRLIALLALPAPAALQPAIYVGLTVLVQGLSCALLAALLRTVVADGVLCVVAALATAAVVPADEVIGSVANLQWYVALPVFCAAIVPLERGAARTLARVAAVLVGLTTPQGVFALPVAAFVWWRRPAGRDPWIAMLYAASSVLNVATAPRDAGLRPTPHVVQAVLDVLAFRVGDAVLLGKPAAQALAAATPALGLMVGLALLLAVIVAVWRTYGSLAALTAAYAIGAPVAFVLATRSLPAADLAGYAFFGADRYFIAPSAAVLVALTLACARLPQRAAARVLLVALLLPGAYFGWREPARLPDAGWRAAVPALEAWRNARDGGGPAAAAGAPILPPGWVIALPACGAGSRGGLFPSCS